MNTIQIPTRIKIAQGLLLVQAMIWLGFGLWTWFRPSATPSMMIILALLMIVNTPIFLGMAWGIGKRIRLAFYLALIFLAIHFILTITDQAGIFDLLIFILDLATLVFLVWIYPAFKGKIA